MHISAGLLLLNLLGHPTRPPFAAEGMDQPFERGQPAVLWLQTHMPVDEIEGDVVGRPILWVPWSSQRILGLAAIDVDDPVGEHLLRLRYTLEVEHRYDWQLPVEVIERDYPRNNLRVAPRYTRLSAADRQRVRGEKRMLAELWQRRADERLWRGSFMRPLSTPVTSPFGVRRIFNGKQRSRHLGLDLDGNGGEPIAAANRGRVALAQALFYAGNAVVLDHGQGLYTMYFHLQRIDVEPGQLVDKGQHLGLVGRTGRVTGPHLHFGVKLAGVYVDPATLLALDLSDDPLAPTPASRPAR